MPLTIIDALNDPNLFGTYLDGDQETWRAWKACLRAVYGLPIRSKFSKRVIREVTGRDPDLLPKEGFDTTLFLTGRKSGKSKIAGLIAAFEAAFSGREKLLSPGERGIGIVVSPTRRQSKIVHEYISSIFESPGLRRHKVKETNNSFELSNGITIEVMAGDWRSIRGPAVVFCVVDEACFLGQEEASQIKSDTELINAILPAMSVVEGRLICISSPYSRAGWMYEQWKAHHKNYNSKSTLVINCPSRSLNPRVSQKFINNALAADYAKARSEYFGEWRDDVAAFIRRDLLEKLVVHGRTKLEPGQVSNLNAFCDLAGGSGTDDASLAITSRSNRKIVVALAQTWSPPFAPQRIITEKIAPLLRSYGIRRVVGDRYSANFAVEAFRMAGITYIHSEMPRSELYLECLPKLTSGEVELLDNDRLIDQFANLERKTRSNGRDVVDHPPGRHDDLSNSVAGAIAHAVQTTVRVGGFGPRKEPVPKALRNQETDEFQDSFLEVLRGQRDFKITQHRNIF